jgi:hypothetical protein
MDPWLEHPGLWPGVHNRLITALADELVPKVAPKYFVDVEERTYVTSATGDGAVIRPDILVGRTASRRRTRRPAQSGVAVAEPETDVVEMDVVVPVEISVDTWYLEVRTVATNKLVTVIEVLSPTNKSAGLGRKEYLRMRNRIFKSRTSLVEIDLLRDGRPMPLTSQQPGEGCCRILVSRGASRPQAKLYAFGVRQPIPPIPIPLLPKDPEPSLELGAVLHALYERARFDLRLDYTKPPVPPLGEENAAWARGIVADRAEAR